MMMKRYKFVVMFLLALLTGCYLVSNSHESISVPPTISQNKYATRPFVKSAIPNDNTETPYLQTIQVNGYPVSTKTVVPRVTANIESTETVTPDFNSYPTSSNFGIFVWNQITDKTAIYGYFDSRVERQIEISSLSIPKGTSIPGPNRSIAFSFSPFTNKIAYFTRDNSLNLCVSDILLRTIKHIWSDNEKWLGDIRGNQDIRTMWGINDRYLIISSNVIKSHHLIIDFMSENSYQIDGNCDAITRSTFSRKLAIVCSKSTGNEVILLDSGGIVKLSSSLMNMDSGIYDWSYSKDGERVLYITKNRKIVIVDSSGNQLILPLTFQVDSGLSLTLRKNLQWSKDSKQVLVYGVEQSSKHCPLQKNSGIQDDYSQRSCWFLLDSITGEIIWWPQVNIQDILDIPWEYLRNEYDATLSPDGGWIATTFTDSREGNLYYLLALSTTSEEVKVVALEQAQSLLWQ